MITRVNIELHDFDVNEFEEHHSQLTICIKGARDDVHRIMKSFIKFNANVAEEGN